MVFYLANIFIILCYGVFLNLYASKYGAIKRSKKIFIVIACIHLGLIMALRSITVGTDTKLYSGLYEQISYTEDIFNVIVSAPLYVVYNKAISLLFSNTQWIIIFNSLIITFGIGLFIYRNSPNLVMSIYFYITLYFYFKSFNISRQFIAVVLILNSYYYLKNNRIKKYLMLIAAATAVHNTALVALILWPLKKIKWSNLKICLLAIVTTLSIFSYEKFVNIFLTLFPRYLMYMGDATTNLSAVTQGKKIMVTLFYLMIIILCMSYLKLKKRTNFEAKNELYFLTAILTIAVTIGIVFYNNLLISRIEIYFSLFIIIYIPLFIEQLRGKTKVLLYYVLMIITAIPMLVQLSNNISGVVPYEFFWNQF